MSSRNFFLNAFGFIEDRVYAENRKRLFSNSSFVSHNIEVMMQPLPSVAEAKAAADVTEDEESNMMPLPAPVKVTIPREGCLIRKYQRQPSSPNANSTNAHAVDCGKFWTPSVAELRAVVSRELQDETVISLLKPYRDAKLKASSASLLAEASKKGRIGSITVDHTIGDSRALHSEPSYRGAVFQAASQFNYLEFPGPGVTPEHGVTCYIYDRTQGPACAVACAAGTAYRNYLSFVDKKFFKQGLPNAPAPETVGEASNVSTNTDPSNTCNNSGHDAASFQRGQTEVCQLNGLFDIETALGRVGQFFDVRNGYVDSDKGRLVALNRVLLEGDRSTEHSRVNLRSPHVECLIDRLRIGIQQDTEVTDLVAAQSSSTSSSSTRRFLVTQTYNSALSVGYSRVAPGLWAPLATLVLAGTYEATMLMGVLQAIEALKAEHAGRSGFAMVEAGTHSSYPSLPTPPPILLTKVGGGVFGNSSSWIIEAMERAFHRVSQYDVPLNVLVTHFGSIDADYDCLRKVY